MDKEKFCKLSRSMGYISFHDNPEDYCKDKPEDYEYTDDDFMQIYRMFKNDRIPGGSKKYHHIRGFKTTKSYNNTNV